MAVNATLAAQRLCAAADWKLTQLSVHKGLYLAHMTFLGKTDGQPLISERFQAWDYGPVIPSLYHELKMFGRKPVRDIFWTTGLKDDTPEAQVLDAIGSQIKSISPSALVHFTHDPKGAWAKHYRAGARGITIPNEDILEEYKWRPKKSS